MKRISLMLALISLASCTTTTNPDGSVTTSLPQEVFDHLWEALKWAGTFFGPALLEAFLALFS